MFRGGVGAGEELFFDSTKVEANADVHSFRSCPIAQNHLKELFEDTADTEEKQIGDLTAPQLNPEASAAHALPASADEALKESNAQKKRKKDWISRNCSQNRTFSSGRATEQPTAW